MTIDLKEFRDRVHFTQAEMAQELGIKTSTYAMIERGARKVTPGVQKAFLKLHAKFPAPSMSMSLGDLNLADDLTALLQRVQLTAGSLQEQAAVCMMEIFDLQHKLKAMRNRFNKALEFIQSADVQLKAIYDPVRQRDAFMMLSIKRRKAIKIMNEIVAQNPARLMVKLEVLKHEKIILENAAKKGDISWLTHDASYFIAE